MAISKNLRYEVFRRDGHRCRYCGHGIDDGVKLTVDHVVPTTLGGTDEPSNLVAACQDCNAGKSASPPNAEMVADVDDRALRWRDAMDIAGWFLAGQRADRDVSRDCVRRAFHKWTWTSPGGVQHHLDERLPLDWPLSVDAFVHAGLTADELEDAADRAIRRSVVEADDKWRYFCGVAWKLVAEKRDAALYFAERDKDKPRQQP